jgi:hypothetical protein
VDPRPRCLCYDYDHSIIRIVDVATDLFNLAPVPPLLSLLLPIVVLLILLPPVVTVVAVAPAAPPHHDLAHEAESRILAHLTCRD